MFKRRKNICIFIAFLFIVFNCVFFDRSIAMAAIASDSQKQMTNESSDNSYRINNQNVDDILKYLVTVILAGIVSFIGIYKFFVEKQYEIELVNINLVNERVNGVQCYTKFMYNKVYKGKERIKSIGSGTPYYLDISIKLSIPETRKKVDAIVIKKLVFCMNGYKLKYKREKDGFWGSKKCKVDKQNDICLLFLNFPSIKEDDLKKLNPINAFQEPKEVFLKLKWRTIVNVFSIFGFLFNKSANVKFEKAEYQKYSAQIGIKSKGIY